MKNKKLRRLARFAYGNSRFATCDPTTLEISLRSYIVGLRKEIMEATIKLKKVEENNVKLNIYLHEASREGRRIKRIEEW